ncbi:MAG: glycosyltransferase [Lutibacter sp.]|nr:glycosyltransferase [Lutibacter sp.]
MKRIIVSVTNDLVTDQRVQKVCDSLQQNGYDIYLIGRKRPESDQVRLPFKTFRYKLLFDKGFWFYAEYNLRLFWKLLFIQGDILLANDLDTLLANYLASKLSGKKLVYDSHELFTEVPELAGRPLVRHCWLMLEKKLLPGLSHCYTVSPSIVRHYKEQYGVAFTLIRNFPTQKKQSKKGSFPFKIDNKKLILYQGALNKGRGLELMLDTLCLLKDTLFIIIGSGDIEKSLQKKARALNLGEKVVFLGAVPPTALQELTPLADLGISLEADCGLNYRYALPNKLFDYIQARVPVLVADLPEMKHMVLTHQVGEIAFDRNPQALAKQIENMLNKRATYTTALNTAASRLTWENESQQLIELFRSL